ncbi:plasmid pRiA4b ORF-3 family protein [Clostridium vincentii]|uniref:plasmid pRiA4b ORF-3 family protein n=1 Tax=Clostridium vincentii TaxID=52704 RepID=UPI003119C567
MRQPQTLKIDKYIEKYKTFEYVYDFGDYWKHKIELEKIVEDYPFGYPVVIEGEGACPPENVRGLGGYVKFLEAWNNPEHE